MILVRYAVPAVNNEPISSKIFTDRENALHEHSEVDQEEQCFRMEEVEEVAKIKARG